ncbi:hypothetical protein [Breoghania sp.]|uniref:hypothetical protein n=1 Tax=Breoghania sp. TaxID=2065378 RepID=UPI002AA846B0|nr:hypothetical protein [Breoghania sp.]
MGRYRKIDVRIWNDEKFRELSDFGQLAFLFILTHPNMTALGAMRATLPGLAAEKGWNEKAFRKAFGEASGRGMVEHDERASIIALPNFLKYNQPESPNVVKAWEKALDLIPESELKILTIQRAQAFAIGKSEGYAKALPEAFTEAFVEGARKSMRKQEQEQEPEQEPEPEQKKTEHGSRCLGGTREREFVPAVQSKKEAVDWLQQQGVFPGDYEGFASLMMQGRLRWTDIRKGAA